MVMISKLSICLALTLISAKTLPSNQKDLCDNQPYWHECVVVVWHGLNSDCCTGGVAKAVDELRDNYPDSYIRSIKIGESIQEDFMRSFFGNVNDQVDMVCKMLKEDEHLADGFNAIGLSQGGQFFRAYVERCNDPPVHNLITFGSQHQGVMRFPGCVDGVQKSSFLEKLQENGPGMVAGNFGLSCAQLDGLLKEQVYKAATQASIIPAQYIKMPERIDDYLKSNRFLTDINNELPEKNESYKQNMLKLNKFVMYMFDNDDVVVPRQSSHFGFHNGTHVQSLEEQDIYIEDWIGLRELNERGDLIRETLPGQHVEFNVGLIAESVRPFLAQKNPNWPWKIRKPLAKEDNDKKDSGQVANANAEQSNSASSSRLSFILLIGLNLLLI